MPYEQCQKEHYPMEIHKKYLLNQLMSGHSLILFFSQWEIIKHYVSSGTWNDQTCSQKA